MNKKTLVAAVAAGFAIAAQAQMSLPGSFAVSTSGAATYNLPLQLPPGVAGLEPKLALSYHSRAGNGPLGVGWSLSGLSVISRCPQTKAQDGDDALPGVNYKSTDRYCMDGQRLMLMSGTEGANGAEYRAEINRASKIVASTESGVTGGPASFEVRTKDGRIMEFGATDDSRIFAVGKTAVRAWLLDKITDQRGNYIKITYTGPDRVGGDYYPKRIDYTGNASVSPVRPALSTVLFTYEARPDTTPTYTMGSAVTMSHRLATISTGTDGAMAAASATADNANALRYELEYAPDADGSRLVNVRQCAAQTEKCLPPTHMVWSDAAARGWTTISTSGASGGVPVSNRCLPGDFNGDGRTDITCTSGNGYWTTQYATGKGWTVFGATGITTPQPLGGNCLPGDFNGDGRTDIICYDDDSGAWSAQLATSQGWTPRPIQGTTRFLNPPKMCLPGDYDGDGRVDVACYNAFTKEWLTLFSTGTGWRSLSAAGAKLADSVSNSCLTGEFNGDGRTDITCYDLLSQTWTTQYATATGWSVSSQKANATMMPVTQLCTPGDFNGDGLTDISCYRMVENRWSTQYATGAGWSDLVSAVGLELDPPVGESCLSGDFNGDGLADISCYSGSNGIWNTQFSTGSAWVVSKDSGYAAATPSGLRCLGGDFDGDGRTDISCNTDNYIWVTQYSQAGSVLGSQVVRLQPSTASDGIAVTYARLPQLLGDGYTPAATLAYPRVAAPSAMSVVRATNADNGLGGTHRIEYSYGGLVAEQGTGRGLLGFDWMMQEDMNSGLATRSRFHREWPFTGMAYRVERGTASNRIGDLGSTQTTYALIAQEGTDGDVARCGDTAPGTIGSCAATAVAAGRRYVVYASQVDTFKSDWDGSRHYPMPGTRVLTSAVDGYGNVGNVVTKVLTSAGAETGYSKSVINTYAPADKANWIVGRLLRSSVTTLTPP